LLVQQGYVATLQERLPTTTSEGLTIPVTLSASEKKMMERAHSAILLSLSDLVLREVISETTVSGLWKKLESKYMKKSLTNRLYQKQRLYTLRMEEVTPIKSHIDEFNKIMPDLEGLGVTVANEDQVLILLC